jgi:hypothetical protein
MFDVPPAIQLRDLSNGFVSVDGSKCLPHPASMSLQHHSISNHGRPAFQSGSNLRRSRSAADPHEIIVAADLSLPIAVREKLYWRPSGRACS